MLTSVWFVCVTTTFYTKVCILSYFILGVALQIVTCHTPSGPGGTSLIRPFGAPSPQGKALKKYVARYIFMLQFRLGLWYNAVIL